MTSGTDFPDDVVRTAWRRAVDHRGVAERIDLPGGLVAAIQIDQGVARVTVLRARKPLTREDAMPIVERLLLLGDFEPFPLASVRADGHAMVCELDLAAYETEQRRRSS